jgi:hypothetical protein
MLLLRGSLLPAWGQIGDRLPAGHPLRADLQFSAEDVPAADREAMFRSPPACLVFALFARRFPSVRVSLSTSGWEASVFSPKIKGRMFRSLGAHR